MGGHDWAGNKEQILKYVNQVKRGSPGKDLELDEDWVWDDVDDKELDVTKVREAKKEEISYMKPRGTWSDVDENQCRRMTEEPLVNVKWVDTDQKTEREPLIGSSLVARDVRDKGDKDRQVLFAATLPLEAKRQLNLSAGGGGSSSSSTSKRLTRTNRATRMCALSWRARRSRERVSAANPTTGFKASAQQLRHGGACVRAASRTRDLRGGAENLWLSSMSFEIWCAWCTRRLHDVRL